MNNDVLFNRYWPLHPDIILMSDKANEISKKIDFTFYWYNAEFSERLYETLINVKSQYVLLTLDDYLVFKEVNAPVIDSLVDYMKNHDISYLRLYTRSKTHYGMLNKEKRIHHLLLKKKCYEVNLYPSIWRTDDLRQIIFNKNENIWKFEVRMTRRAREKAFLCGWVDNKGIYDFVDTIRKGKYIRGAYRFLKKEKLYISDRPKRTVKETLLLNR